MTCWQSLFETAGISRHLRELPSGNSSSHRDLLPAFDPETPYTKTFFHFLYDIIGKKKSTCTSNLSSWKEMHIEKLMKKNKVWKFIPFFDLTWKMACGLSL